MNCVHPNMRHSEPMHIVDCLSSTGRGTSSAVVIVDANRVGKLLGDDRSLRLVLLRGKRRKTSAATRSHTGVLRIRRGGGSPATNLIVVQRTGENRSRIAYREEKWASGGTHVGARDPAVRSI